MSIHNNIVMPFPDNNRVKSIKPVLSDCIHYLPQVRFPDLENLAKRLCHLEFINRHLGDFVLYELVRFHAGFSFPRVCFRGMLYISLPGDSDASGFFRVCFCLPYMKKAREIDSHELEIKTEK